MPTHGPAAVVSIEVDGRQAYLLETDKWREMLGASRIIDGTVDEAQAYFEKDAGLFLFGPVSGDIRAWAKLENRDALLAAAWRLRRWLAARGVEHTCAYLECSADHFLKHGAEREPEPAPQTRASGLKPEPAYPSLAWVYQALTHRIDDQKTAKDQADARPVCSLFAPCRLHGLDFANEWTPGANESGGEPRRDQRRDQRSFRAGAKYRTWMREREQFLHQRLQAPIQKKLLERLGRDVELPQRRITFQDLADQLDSVEGPGGDQYIGFLKADGDGFGDLITHIDWNSSEWDEKLPLRTPWERNRDFATQLKGAIDEAFKQAIAEVIVPEDPKAAEALAAQIEAGADLPLPVLPQLVGGDDMWTLAGRAVALPLATAFSSRFAQLAASDDTLGAGRKIADRIGAKQHGSSWRPFVFSISIGVAFAKAGFPVHAMHDAADWLILKAKNRRRATPAGRPQESCFDWHWIQSSLNEEVGTARRRGFMYEDRGVSCRLTSRPWTLRETNAFLAAARLFNHLPRRKREQLDPMLRRGAVLSNLAWEAWWNGLRDNEQQRLFEVAKVLEEVGFDLHASRPAWNPQAILPWIQSGADEKMTPFIDLVGLHDVLKGDDA